ncbi:hypothetical protein NVI2019_OHEONHNH_02976 [Providencia alcalifaciens]|nr:hypothetical protein NVI2019_OHEONHNH_02976 [Providencia alcalifaciens]CAG9432492.1 hypothetical protein NVI2019_PLFLNFOB_03471 [Providencia alcalifaciens]CAG9432645.1 hypothetical protein NVI2019_KOLGMIGM_03472 [Providencia alcalifaciens]CAG9433558.1 hypothetical protein NVI2019_OGMBKCAO_03472 [Providencia alcalifaciens]CAG9433785.1 hypothetical protein NVI2019_ANGEOOBF_03471 [Providencia alcalifaciens]
MYFQPINLFLMKMHINDSSSVISFFYDIFFVCIYMKNLTLNLSAHFLAQSVKYMLDIFTDFPYLIKIWKKSNF